MNGQGRYSIWLPQKINPMLCKTPETEEATFIRRGLLTPGRKFTILVTRKVQTSRFGLPAKEDCLLICHIMKECSVICCPIIEKENGL